MILIKEGNSYKKIDEKEKFLKENKGIYRFYVQENKFNSICDKLGLDKTIKNTVENIPYKEETYYCVYVGKTTSKIGYYGRIVKDI